MDGDFTNAGAVTSESAGGGVATSSSTNERADVGGGSSSQGQDDDRSLPFNSHPRFRQVLGEAKEYRTKYEQINRELEQLREEHGKWERGESETLIGWAGEVQKLVREEERGSFEAKLKRAGLYDAFQKMEAGQPVAAEDKKDVNEILKTQMSEFEQKFEQKLEQKAAAQRITSELTNQYQSSLSKSDYKDSRRFKAIFEEHVKKSVMVDHQKSGKWRSMDEYMAEAEKAFEEELREANPAFTKRRTATPAAKTLGGAGLPAGGSRRDQLNQQREAILQEMDRSRR